MLVCAFALYYVLIILHNIAVKTSLEYLPEYKAGKLALVIDIIPKEFRDDVPMIILFGS